MKTSHPSAVCVNAGRASKSHGYVGGANKGGFGSSVSCNISVMPFGCLSLQVPALSTIHNCSFAVGKKNISQSCSD